jgi:hypothetical protein
MLMSSRSARNGMRGRDCAHNFSPCSKPSPEWGPRMALIFPQVGQELLKKASPLDKDQHAKSSRAWDW